MEVLLAKYGELILKGLNKRTFEAMMLRQFRRRLARVGQFNVYELQSTVYVEPLTENEDMDEAMRVCTHIFGVLKVSRALVVEKNMDAILAAARDYIPQFLVGKKSFKAESKRADKRFPLTSIQISQAVGTAVGEMLPDMDVDMDHPEVVVVTEIREKAAYLHAGAEPGAGGMPACSSGTGLLLLSGGIDSPVAGYMMAKRGLRVEALHFESYPYTSEQARDKVLELAKEVCAYTERMNVNVLSVTHLQEELRDRCEEEFFTLLLRRSMMRLANRVAQKLGAYCLVTGESLGQVASQTLDALRVTNAVSSLPVFRPCIGMDKEEIVTKARQIGTFETSIEPYEDCCTVFTPKHPKTRPELDKLLEEEKKIDFAALEAKAFAGINTVVVQNGNYKV